MAYKNTSIVHFYRKLLAFLPHHYCT